MSDSKSCHKSWVARHIAGLPRSGIRDFFELVNTMDEVISLGIGEPDFTTPWHIREAAIYALNRGYTSYTSNLGDLRLRKAICTYAKENFGVSYRPEQECIVTVGVSEGLDILLRAVLNPATKCCTMNLLCVLCADNQDDARCASAGSDGSQNDFVIDVADLEVSDSRGRGAFADYRTTDCAGGLGGEEEPAAFAVSTISWSLVTKYTRLN